MKLHGYVLCFFLASTTQAVAQTVVITTTKVRCPSYICFDGRTLDRNTEGFVWLAKRGCFITRTPCKEFQAGHYGMYNDTYSLRQGYARCKRNYTFHLGEMQTH